MGKRSPNCEKELYSEPPPMLAGMGVGRQCLIDSLDGRDFYPTPYEAVVPVIPHLWQMYGYCEPCAGDGALVRHLSKHKYICASASDIKPRSDNILERDVFSIQSTNADFFITNPPWNRSILHPLIVHLSDIAPTWLLFDADWMHTRQSAPFMGRCQTIVSVGRIKWIPDSKMTGKDNCAWYLFDAKHSGPTEFHGRA